MGWGAVRALISGLQLSENRQSSPTNYSRCISHARWPSPERYSHFCYSGGFLRVCRPPCTEFYCGEALFETPVKTLDQRPSRICVIAIGWLLFSAWLVSARLHGFPELPVWQSPFRVHLYMANTSISISVPSAIDRPGIVPASYRLPVAQYRLGYLIYHHYLQLPAPVPLNSTHYPKHASPGLGTPKRSTRLDKVLPNTTAEMYFEAMAMLTNPACADSPASQGHARRLSPAQYMWR